MVLASRPDGQQFSTPTLPEGAPIGNFVVQWPAEPALILQRSRKPALVLGVIGLLLLVWGAAAAFALALKPAIVLVGGGIVCLICSLGHYRVRFDETGVRFSSLLGIRERHVASSDLQNVRIVLDDLPVQGCTVALGLRSGRKLTLDARNVISSPHAPNHVFLALWIGKRFNVPVECDGQLRDPDVTLADLLLEIFEHAVAEDSDQNPLRHGPA